MDILLELQKNGVQIFISTHDYILSKYFEVKRQNTDNVEFYSFYQSDDDIKCEKNKNFRDLKNNKIVESFDILLDEVFDKSLGD
ncbi:hypothetical protein [Clostridium botulinum]|uniref:hypothetical protein n=1 Tax=Clostridium botulinum TaxID=1491 RepID=UPI001E5C76D8|nr:hypothetical protein [Clostridium botulinum]